MTRAEPDQSFSYRLAAIDLDGTLLGPDKQIGPENLAAVKALQDRGVKIVLASGRRHQNSVRFYRQLDLDTPIIACQGALVFEGVSGKILESTCLTPGLAEQLVTEAEKSAFHVIYYGLQHLYVADRQNPWIELYESRIGEPTEVCADLHELRGADALKIVWYGDATEAARLRIELEARYSGVLDVLSTEKENLEFMPLGVSKATALAGVVQRFGIRPEEVLAFGDGENDVAMLSWAGLGVAMSHGHDRAKSAAKLIGPSGDAAADFARGVQAVFEQNGR